MNKKALQASILMATALLCSGCRTTMTLGGAEVVETKIDPTKKSVCLAIEDGEKLYGEAKGLGFHFDASAFFEATLRSALSSYFSLDTDDDCDQEDLPIYASLKELYFIGNLIGPGPFPLSEAESHALVELQVLRSGEKSMSIIEKSNSFKAVEIADSRVVMVVVARAAIRDAVTRSVQRLACNQGVAQCIDRTIEQQKIERALLEYQIIKKEGEPRVHYTIFGISFESWL